MTLKLLGYDIAETIYAGVRTLVYRGMRQSDGKPVAIKILRNNCPSFNELLQFRNQYAIAHNLKLPGIIDTLSLEAHNNGYALVMEDFGGISLQRWRNRTPVSLKDFFPIALSLCDILDTLARQRIIHKDIKPANILIHPESKEIKLIDFSIASLLPKETQEIQSPNILEGTLAYLAPEQTGRMNRGVDYRSDFYSLGITFYQILTGILPFAANDPLELIHCHMAKMPQPIEEINTEVPAMVGAIATKLMAKNAESRYQSAFGIKHDLEWCFREWQETGAIEPFSVGTRDLCDRFLIPEKLYGRKAEVEALLAAFERVSQGAVELVLVAGFSGIGKTAVVSEVHKPITQQKGYFIKGKFDQFNRNSPLSAFVQALRDLMGQLLSESDAALVAWKAKLLAAVGENGQVLIEVIPELEQIIGPQPDAPELGGSAAENRFNRLFGQFINLFSTAAHPLTLFIDDWQWADAASLKLMKVLMADNGYLLMLGAYRDNEVSPVHPFIMAVEGLEKADKTVSTITLAPLAVEDTNHLIADTLHCSAQLAQPLTELIDRKTKGNPFFTTQFLKALYEDGQIAFDRDRGYWQCDIARVNALALTDDVVEFMAAQLQKLPDETQNILKLAACVGNQFDLDTLAIISATPPAEAATCLWSALQEGSILPISQVYKFFQSDEHSQAQHNANPTYRFIHDRVQQAAYSLIPEAQKQTMHYRIGRLLLNGTRPENREEHIFGIVGHLNYALSSLNRPEEQAELAQLNLLACQKAKRTTAYQSGWEYVQAGWLLLGENSWQHHYETVFTLSELAVEFAALCGNWSEMDRFVDEVVAHSRSLVEQANVYRIQIQANISRHRLAEAIAIAFQFLKKLGITFPEEPSDADMAEAIAQVQMLMGDRQVEDLLSLPEMQDPDKIAIFQITRSIFSATHMSAPRFFPLVVSCAVSLSIQYGNAPSSSFAYACYGLLLSSSSSPDVTTGVAFAQLSLQLLDKFAAKTAKPEVLLLAGEFLLHRTAPIRDTLPLLQAGYTSGLETGNYEFVGYNAHSFCSNSFWCGEPLDALIPETRAYCHHLEQINQFTAADYIRICWQAELNLIERSENPTLLSGEGLQEDEAVRQWQETNSLQALYIFHTYKLMLCFLFGEIEATRTHIEEGRKCLLSATGMVNVPVAHFYGALSVIAAIDGELDVDPEHRAKDLAQVQDNLDVLQQWADHAPMNHQHKINLVEAEKCRISGHPYEAGDYYDRAIAGAKENGFIQEEALTNELAARFYLNWGKEKVAAGYMQEAYYGYARWGAKAKTDDLEARYPQLLQPILQPPSPPVAPGATAKTGSLTESSSIPNALWLDLPSILRASQALSQEIELEKLLEKLLTIILANAGAERGHLILQQQGQWQVVARGQEHQIRIDVTPLEGEANVPRSVIYAVARSQKTMVFDNLAAAEQYARDADIAQRQPKSVLCTPLLNQRKLMGILYLENNLTAGTFTPERVEILQLFAGQAAISLDNARLYRETQNYSYTLESEVERKTKALQKKATDLETALGQLQQTQAQLIQTEKMSSLGQLVAGIAHEINNPVSFISGNIIHTRNYFDNLLGLLNMYQEEYPQPNDRIDTKATEIEFDFLAEDANNILASMKHGSDRIAKIVDGLRNFSRLDESPVKTVDLCSGLDSTLLILNNRLQGTETKPEISVIKEYNKLPLITCYPSQLNQVFLNIINNAIDAIRDNPHASNTPTIRIRAETLEQTIHITISNSDSTISPAILDKIFDPFFTTKSVGKGTGLGLFVSHSIIEQHGGTLRVRSVEGEGTEFLIAFPTK